MTEDMTRENAQDIAVASNLNFLLLKHIAAMSRVTLELSLPLLEGGVETEMTKKLAVIAEGLTRSNGLIKVMMDHYEGKLGPWGERHPTEREEIIAGLRDLPEMQAMELEEHMSGSDRVAQLLFRYGKGL